LSPTSSIRLAERRNPPPPERTYEPPTFSDNEEDASSSPDDSRHRHHKRRRRRDSDPTSDRPNLDHQVTKHRRRSQHTSPDESEEEAEEIEELPPRFDEHGRPIDQSPKGAFNGRGWIGGFKVGDWAKKRKEEKGDGGGELVEKIARGVQDVVEGKKNWKDVLRGFMEEAGVGGAPPVEEPPRRRRRRHDD
jgi:hypothetical protein